MRPVGPTLATLALLLAVLTGCAGNQPGQPTPDRSTSTVPSPGSPLPAPDAVRVVLVRSGGIAGLAETLTVEPDGRWTLVDRTEARRSGQIGEADLDRLRQLAGDPRLAVESGRTTGPTVCRDALTYRLSVGATEIDYIDCPADGDQPEVAMSLVELLTRVTD